MKNPAARLPSRIQNLPAYTPIEPFEVLSERVNRSPKDIIKLDANENPYGMSPKAKAALSTIDFPHIYPDPESRSLRKSLAGFTGANLENLLAGSGADELIDLIMRVMLDQNDCIINCPPTFGMYTFDANLNGVRVIDIPRKLDFSLNLPEVISAVSKNQPKILFLSSPNNPDGSLIQKSILDELLALDLMIVLDEAYIEFADPEQLGKNISMIQSVQDKDNLIVLRTFSKLAGLAGLRAGYGAFPGWLMPALWKAKQPYNVNVAASVASIASLEDAEYLQKTVSLLVDEREKLMKVLETVSYLRPVPSSSNFILCQVIGRDAAELKNKLSEKYGIFVRYFNKPGLMDCIRISIGKPEQMNTLMTALLDL